MCSVAYKPSLNNRISKISRNTQVSCLSYRFNLKLNKIVCDTPQFNENAFCEVPSEKCDSLVKLYRSGTVITHFKTTAG